MGGVVFQIIYFTTASIKLGGQAGKRHLIYCPLQEGQQDELFLFHTENSHQVHTENTDKDLQKATPDLNREARGMHTCKKPSSASSDTHQPVLGKKFPHDMGNNIAVCMLITDTAQVYLKATSQITFV